MKLIRLILICWLLMCGRNLITTAQPYKSVFAKDTTQWNVTYRIPDLMPTFIYKAYGDTIINAKNYKFLYKGYWYYFGEKYGYLREDTTTGKLWFLSLDNKEQVIMDLSLVKADTFTFPNDIQYTVDAVFYKAGKKYIAFNGVSKDSVFFIEGIGPSNFLSFNQVTFPEWAKIRCKFDDHKLVFHDQSYRNCIDTITGIDEKQINNFIVYPNPVSKELFVEGNFKAKGYNLELYSVKGELVKTECLDSRINQYRVDVSNLKNGIYILHLIATSGKYEEQVIIKK